MASTWTVDSIIARAARDYADQFHFARGAGDDAAAYEVDYLRAKTEIAETLHSAGVAVSDPQRRNGE